VQSRAGKTFPVIKVHVPSNIVLCTRHGCKMYNHVCFVCSIQFVHPLLMVNASNLYRVEV
jgi:hypothetical protein